MKIVKGSKWLKRDFLEQLKQLLETNHVVEIDELVDFDGKEQFIKNMIIRRELAEATDGDAVRQVKIEHAERLEALRDERFRDKVKEEETALKAVMGL